jgi:ligand-binding SRPBCC domain-containing protein
VLHAPFEFVCQTNGKERRIQAVHDFVTDFASIPRMFWSIAPRWGRYGWAAVIHDFLYWDQSLTRREADDVFLNAMKKSAVPVWRRTIIYAAVRVFGCNAWKSNTKAKARDPRARFLDEELHDPFKIKKWKGYLARKRLTSAAPVGTAGVSG